VKGKQAMGNYFISTSSSNNAFAFDMTSNVSVKKDCQMVELEIEWKILNCESERADYASVREQDHQHTAMR
jgi:hypothetical protein